MQRGLFASTSKMDEVTSEPMNVGSQGSFCWFEKPLLFLKRFAKTSQKVQLFNAQVSRLVNHN